MAQRATVPQFGNWEGADDVPYTVYFDKARRGRTAGRIVNPNDPQQNPDLAPTHAPPAPATSSRARAGMEESTGQGHTRQGHERGRSREENELRQYVNSPARGDNVNRRAANESVPQRYGGRGETHRRPGRPSAGSENSFERSPMHHHARISGRGSGAQSPAWDGRGAQENSYGTPGRTRLRPRGDESPDRSPAVPRFGEWNENDPASAEGYTHIFNQVREERNQGVAGRVSSRPTEPSHGGGYRQTPGDSSKGCCFPWFR